MNKIHYTPIKTLLQKIISVCFIPALTMILFFGFASKVQAQVLYDSFSDGNFTANPVWGGNTSLWTVVASSDAAAGATGSNTLRMSGTAVSATDYLSSQISTWSTSQEWGFFLGRRAQAFTAANQAYFWLYANESTLNNLTVDGYRIAIGDDSGGDEIRLEYVVNGVVSATVISSSTAITNGLTDIGLLIRVTRSSSGVWTLFSSTIPTANGTGAIATDIPNTANTPVTLGTATNNTLPPAANGYIGVAALHSTGASAIIATEFDQVYFTAANAVTLGNITQPSGPITQGTANSVISGFTITPATGSVDFTAVTVNTGSGTATSSDVSNVRIFRDNGTIGIIDGTDAAVSGTSSYSASMPFTISGETGFSSVRNYLIVADVAGVGVSTPLNTIQLNVASGAFTTTGSSNTGSATGNVRTIVAPAGTTSISSASSASTVSSVINSQAASINNYSITVTDDGSNPSTDNVSTLISQIVFNAGTGNTITDWTLAIAGAVLTDGTNSITASSITASSITFAGIPTSSGALGEVVDDASKTYSLKIWLKTDLTTLKNTIDGQNFVFRVQTADVTTSGAGSQLASGLDINSGATNNVVDVSVSKLAYVLQPVNSNTVSTVPVTVAAIDANGNRDLGFIGQVRITSTAGAALNGTPVDAGAISGLASFSLTFNAPGTFTLTAKRTATLDLDTISSSFTIIVLATINEIILPQYAVNEGSTPANRLQYVCRLQLNNLTPNATYRYYTGGSTATSLTGAAAGNFFIINNTSGANGYITGESSAKGFTGPVMSGDEFTTVSRYGELIADASGTYTGWFSMVPTSNAVFAGGNVVYFYVQLNDGAGGTTLVQSPRTTSTISMLNPTSGANGARAIRGTSSGTPENMVFLYDNVAGTGRPVYGTWLENDGITTNYATWYAATPNPVEGVNGSWGAYIPSALPNGIRRIEQRNVSTAAIEGCAGTDADGVWTTGSVNTVNPTGGTTPLVISSTDASFVCPILNTISTGTITPLTYCVDGLNYTSVSVPFTSTFPFNSGNIYTAQLSDASGSFTTHTDIGTLSSTANSGTIPAQIPPGTPSGIAYRIRVISSSPSVTGTDNGQNITLTGGVLYYADNDFDNYGDPNNSFALCTMQAGYVSIAGDCDDFDPSVNPGATEVCDGIDNNCNNSIDEGVQSTFYADGDGDSYGNPNVTTLACTVPSGFVSNSTDCNDANAAINPGATELCNGVDDNCDNTIDENCATHTYFRDLDGDSYGDPATSVTIAATTPPTGYVVNNTDCNDNNSAVNPGAAEICNNLDDNCNSLIDDGLTFITYYQDADGDNFGNPNVSTSSCSLPSGYVTNSTDCDDAHAAVNPSATELCNNGIDDNCNTIIDETTLAGAFNATPIQCNGGTSTVTISATGGVLPYSGTGTFTQSAGTHVYTVTDAASCSSNVTVTLTQPDPISITSFTPSRAARGATVTLTGTGFTGATSVLFNGVAASTFTVVSNTQITAVIPVTATSGLITVGRSTCSGVSATSLTIITLTEVIFPQYIQGVNGTNANRLPFAYRAALNGLLPNATYRYFNGVELTTAALTSAGAGINIFADNNTSAFVLSSTSGLTTTGTYGTFTTDASGSFTGWFVIVPSGNATRFIPGTLLNTRIVLNNGAGGTATDAVLSSTQTIKVINLVASAGSNNGTGLRGNSNATPKNFVFAYDNQTGTGRPVSGTFVESDGTAENTSLSFATFYSTSVDGVSGAYGMVIPNTNSNGIQRIEQRDFTTGAISGCPATDADGVWPSGANTVNPAGGITAVVITNSDAPLFVSPITGSSAVCVGSTITLADATTGGTWGTANAAVATVAGGVVTGVSAGTVTITYTLPSGCSAGISITVNPKPTLSATATQIQCNGGTGSVSLSASGGTSPYIYGGDATTGLTAGTYNYTVTDNNTCTATASAVINPAPAAIVVSGFSPASGAVGSGVVITGSGFTGATAVSFNGINATSFTVDNSGQITTQVPTGATSGNITVYVNTCSGTSSTPFTVTSGSVTLNLTMLIQGLYAGGGTMTSALNNSGTSTDPTEADSVTIELRDPANSNALVESVTGVLKVDGSMQVHFSSAILSNSYYIVVKNRNSIETWSKNPVTFSPVTSFDFAH